jgi:hypothetical protein
MPRPELPKDGAVKFNLVALSMSHLFSPCLKLKNPTKASTSML